MAESCYLHSVPTPIKVVPSNGKVYYCYYLFTRVSICFYFLPSHLPLSPQGQLLKNRPQVWFTTWCIPRGTGGTGRTFKGTRFWNACGLQLLKVKYLSVSVIHTGIDREGKDVGMGWGCLPSMYMALGLSPSTGEKKKKNPKPTNTKQQQQKKTWTKLLACKIIFLILETTRMLGYNLPLIPLCF